MVKLMSYLGLAQSQEDTEKWIIQAVQAGVNLDRLRELTDPVEGFLRDASYLIHDRDPLFTEAFREILAGSGVTTVKIPAKSPNCNPHAERFVKSIKYECLNHFVFFGERHLRYVIKEYMSHYLEERFHQGLGGKLVATTSSANDNNAAGAIACHSRLGGLLNFYHRHAA